MELDYLSALFEILPLGPWIFTRLKQVFWSVGDRIWFVLTPDPLQAKPLDRSSPNFNTINLT